MRLVLTFYRNYAWTSVLISLVCLRMFLLYGAEYIAAVFWIKVVTGGLIFFFVNQYKSNELYYYRNLGISKASLWTFSFSIDFLLLILSMILLASIR